MLTGIDVSSGDGSINWRAVWRAGHRFAYIKASEAGELRDPRFAENWSASGQAGILRGAYHFARPVAGRGGAEEAGFMCEVCGRLGAGALGHLPPAVDIQSAEGLDPDDVHAWAGAFVAEIRQRLGRTPVIYAGQFWKTTLREATDVWGCPLWLADYGTAAEVPAPWTRWTFWQHTLSGVVPGVPGRTLNLDLFDGSYVELQALAHDVTRETPLEVHTTPTTLEACGTAATEPLVSAPPQLPPGPPVWPGRALALGATGDDVLAWQTQMRARGFVTLTADGRYGPDSRRACVRLQRYRRLVADGEVGPETWAATWSPSP
jgi:GH25 family lysozyme M1 (1,4-beta-N-acetylmuramidase)